MTAKEALEQIKSLFAEHEGEKKMEEPKEDMKPEAMEAKEYVLEDGMTKVLISDLEVGGMVSIMNEDGTTAPAPAGDHKLVDGTVITVAENGLISAVVAPTPAPSPEVEEARAAFAELKAQQEAFAAAWTSEKDALHAALKAYDEKLRVMASVVESLLQTPSTEPVMEAKDKFEFHQPSQAEKVKDLLMTIDQMKNKK